MKDLKLSRRSVIGLAGGFAALSCASLPGVAMATRRKLESNEIEVARTRIGTRYQVGDGVRQASMVLEDVAPLSPRVRPPFTIGHRTPFALVFRHESGDALRDGTYAFASDLPSEVMMVSHFTGDDGIDRLEAVFN
jgi:hypothetical protein